MLYVQDIAPVFCLAGKRAVKPFRARVANHILTAVRGAYGTIADRVRIADLSTVGPLTI
jgi:hypothetical protein